MKMSMVGVFLTLSVVACTSQARREALLPGMQNAWPPIEASITRGAEGAEGGPIVEEGILLFREELAKVDGPVVNLMPTWNVLRPYAEADINARLAAEEIGPGVAESLTERLDNFEAAIRAIGAKGLF